MIGVAANLAFRQLTHRGAKLIGALSGVSMAIILIFIQLGFQGSLYDSGTSVARAFDADIILTSRDFKTMAFPWPWVPRHELVQARGASGVQDVAPFYASMLQVADPKDGRNLSCWLFAFPPDQRVFGQSDITSQLDLVRLPFIGLIDSSSRKELGVIASAVIENSGVEVVLPAAAFNMQPYVKLDGTYKIGPTINVDGSIVTSDLNHYLITGVPLDRASLGIVQLVPGTDVAVAQKSIQDRVGPGVHVFTKEQFLRNERQFYSDYTPIGFIFDAGVMIGIVVGIVFISQVLHGIVSDNMREYATLRAMGYPQSFFVALVGIIALSIAAVTYLPSVLVSYIVYDVAANATGLPMYMKPSYLAVVLLLVVVMALIAATMSTRKLKQADPVDLF
jgi:putative ABC transport system permease protein